MSYRLMSIVSTVKACGLAIVALVVLTACAVAPVHETKVVTMGAAASSEDRGLPPPGTTWRLDEAELLALSPAPYVPPPTPIPQPPRVERPVPYVAPYPYYGYGVPYYGVPYYGPSFGVYFGYSHRHGRSHDHRHFRRR